MPLYRFTHDVALEEVARLEAEGEQVVSVSHDQDGVYVATTTKVKRAMPGETETR